MLNVVKGFAANRALRFVLDDERAGVYDNLGATCAQTVEKTVGDMESDELCEIWRGLDEE